MPLSNWRALCVGSGAMRPGCAACRIRGPCRCGGRQPKRTSPTMRTSCSRTGHRGARRQPTVRRPCSGQLAEAVDLYERLPGKRLVVLGPPGSGKSVMAMTLTLALLGRWQPGLRVPVLFPVASWDPSRTRLDDWLAEYLSENYQLSGDSRDSRVVGQKLLAGNMLLPILDGLDEIPVALRPLGIKNLNRELDAAQPIILTCRTAEYREAVETGDVLTLAAVVELQPLHPATITRYLTETTPAGPRAMRWAPVFERLRNDPDGALASVLRTPLMVFLTRAIYGDNPRDPAELLGQRFQDPGSIENHLLTQLIPAAYHDRPRSAEERQFHWQTDDVTSWLTYLARHGADAGRSDLAWWQLERAVPAVVIDAVGGLLAWPSGRFRLRAHRRHRLRGRSGTRWYRAAIPPLDH